MKMSRHVFLAFQLMLCLLFAACAKIDLPDPTTAPTIEEATDTLSAISVAEAQNRKAGEKVSVVGFVVGYIDGSTLSKALFKLPTSENKNFLLADNIEQTDVNHCFPVALVSGSKYREQYNMLSNPGFFRSKVLITGVIEKYFTVNGFRDIESLQLLTDTATLRKGNLRLPVRNTPKKIQLGR